MSREIVLEPRPECGPVIDELSRDRFGIRLLDAGSRRTRLPYCEPFKAKYSELAEFVIEHGALFKLVTGVSFLREELGIEPGFDAIINGEAFDFCDRPGRVTVTVETTAGPVTTVIEPAEDKACGRREAT